nr:MAG TPA: hypothetical protein [Caudoviricetes sp.]
MFLRILAQRYPHRRVTRISLLKNMRGDRGVETRLYSERVNLLGGRGASIYYIIYI